VGGADRDRQRRGREAMPKAGSAHRHRRVPGRHVGHERREPARRDRVRHPDDAGPAAPPRTRAAWYFSNAGQPEVWETDGASGRGRNFVDLTPGDGEQIMAAVTWRELVFIFKETKFFVMWGESTAADGTPVFNFREVVNNVGLAGSRLVCVGRDGVYFLNRRGVYHTNGGDPRCSPTRSRRCGPATPRSTTRARSTSHSSRSRAWRGSTSSSSSRSRPARAPFNDRLLVYDTQHQWWTVYDIPASALAVVPARRPRRAALRVLDRQQPHRAPPSGPRRPTRGNITSRWRSGWSDYDIPCRRRSGRRRCGGPAPCNVGFSTDFNPARRGTWQDWITANGGVWPGGGQVSDALVRRAMRGTVFSTQFSNAPNSPTWSVHRLSRHLRETREASIR
jgi:hypothetical protein